MASLPRKGFVAALLGLCLPLAAAEAGTYLCSVFDNACTPNGDEASIVHPQGYSGFGSSLDLSVCVRGVGPQEEAAVGPLQRAIDTWVQLTETRGNYLDVGASDVPAGTHDLESVFLHEIGHCLGVGHANIGTDAEISDGCPAICDGCDEEQYTASFCGNNDVWDFDSGQQDGIEGTFDDDRGDDVNVFWFNDNFNDPFFVINPVDGQTYTRDPSNLPSSHSAAAWGSLAYSQWRGLADTEAVMAARIGPGVAKRQLSADEVSTILFGRTGLDESVGTSDDYEIGIRYSSDPSDCDLEVEFIDDSLIEGLAQCSFTATELASDHYAITSSKIEVNQDIDWYTGEGTDGDPPDTATNPASGVTDDLAVLNGTVNPNGLSTEGWFVWDDDSFVDAFSTPRVSVGSGSSSVPIAYGLAALDCETTYYFQAWGENSAGLDSGTVRSFTTGTCGGGGGDEELITNGGFEPGSAGWELSGDFQADDRFSCTHSGSGYAYLALPDGSRGDNLHGELDQVVSIPAAADSPELSYFYSISTDDPSGQIEDAMVVWIYDEAGDTALEALATYSNLDAQNGCGSTFYDSAGPFDLSDYIGETIRVRFEAATDSRSGTGTVFRVDDVSLQAEIPPGSAPDVSTESADEITSHSANLNLQVTANGAATDVWFEWDDDPNLSNQTDSVAVSEDAVNHPVSIELSGLNCEETYYFEAFAWNVHGEDDGIQRSFTTGACPGGPPTADTDPAEAITSTSARLTAEILPNGLSTDAWFEWGETTSLGNLTPRQGVGSGTSWVDFDADLASLDCGTTYYFEAHAENSAGEDDGATHSFATHDCDPGNRPPQATGDSYSTPVDAPLSVAAPGVLGNDSDPDGDFLTADLTGDVLHGSLTLHPDGSFDYSPVAGYEGPDSFSYVANDGLLDSSPATVNISVGDASPIQWPDFIDLNTPPGTESVPTTRIYGDYEFGDFGAGVASGDFNNDGFMDALVSAENEEPLGRIDGGAAYVVWGSSTLSEVTELTSSSAGVTQIFGRTDEELGSCVAAGDVNNDGFDDLIIGAETFDAGTDDKAGRVLIVYGGNSLPAMIDMEATSVAMTEIHGPGPTHFLGRSCSVGDVNGDGFADAVAGAPSVDIGGDNDVGKIFIVYGSATLPAVVDLGSGPSGVTEIRGAGHLDSIGDSLGVLDPNADGYGDLAFDSSFATPTNVFVLWGSSSPPSFIDLASSHAGTTRIEEPDSELWTAFGESLAGGDLDGDGVQDLIIGAEAAEYNCNEDCGTVFVLYGDNTFSSHAVIDLGVPPGTEAVAVTRIHGLADLDYLGNAVSTGDVNNDGYSDALLGAPAFGVSAGVTFAIFGRPELRQFVEVPPDYAAFEGTQILGVDALDAMGDAQASGDINGDGFDDAVIGASNAAPGGVTNAGEAYIVYGGVRSLSPPFRTLTVNVLGNGGGTVVSTPSGITCTDWCEAPYLVGSQLDLDASADPGSVFDRWLGGGCTGSAACSVIIDSDVLIGALFIEPGSCGEADTLHLHDLAIESTETFEACTGLSAGSGFSVEPAGDVTLRSGGGVSLENGVIVEGMLAIEIDPSLLP